MAKLCVLGSEGFEQEAKALHVDFKRTGKLVIARYEEDLKKLDHLKEQGEANGVRELRIIGREELERLAGYAAGAGALWSGRTAIFDPFQYTVALAEAAAKQGAEYFFGRQVNAIEVLAQHRPEDPSALKEGFRITAENRSSGQPEIYQAKILINSAGLFADEISRMAGIQDYTVFPCRGEYHILDKKQSSVLNIPIYPIPNDREGGLGVHLTPTIHGNIMVGPSAEYLTENQEREDYSTSGDVMDNLKKEGTDLFPQMQELECIRSFSGIRPKLVSAEKGGYADFVIEESKQAAGLIQLIGIESPGLTASIPIGKMVAQMVEALEMKQKQEKGTEPQAVPERQRGDQKMLCRCEGITEEAVLEAYDRILSIGAIPTIKGLKNRTRVTMGNCQGSFCTINIIELLQKKRQVDPLDLLWNGFGSRMFEGRVRE